VSRLACDRGAADEVEDLAERRVKASSRRHPICLRHHVQDVMLPCVSIHSTASADEWRVTSGGCCSMNSALSRPGVQRTCGVRAAGSGCDVRPWKKVLRAGASFASTAQSWSSAER